MLIEAPRKYGELSAYVSEWFETKADFGCVLWEAKPEPLFIPNEQTETRLRQELQQLKQQCVVDPQGGWVTIERLQADLVDLAAKVELRDRLLIAEGQARYQAEQEVKQLRPLVKRTERLEELNREGSELVGEVKHLLQRALKVFAQYEERR